VRNAGLNSKLSNLVPANDSGEEQSPQEVDSLFGYHYCLCRALNLAGSAYDACIVVYDHRLLSFGAFCFLKLEHRNRAYVHTD